MTTRHCECGQTKQKQPPREPLMCSRDEQLQSSQERRKLRSARYVNVTIPHSFTNQITLVSGQKSFSGLCSEHRRLRNILGGRHPMRVPGFNSQALAVFSAESPKGAGSRLTTGSIRSDHRLVADHRTPVLFLKCKSREARNPGMGLFEAQPGLPATGEFRALDTTDTPVPHGNCNCIASIRHMVVSYWSKPMPKRRRRYKKLLSPRDELIAKLEHLVKTDYAHQHLTEDERTKARSLLRHFVAQHDLTDRQWVLAKSLVKLHNKLGHPTGDDWMLYAMQAGETVKLGLTSNVGSRIKSIQTGQAERVELKWTFPCDNRHEAKTKERKLHRFCRDRHIRGEWFQLDVLDRLEAFK